MKKKLMIIISTLIVVIFGIVIFINYNEQKSEQKITKIQPNEYRINLQDTKKINIDQLGNAVNGKMDGNYYIFIGRPTCPYCRKFSPIIRQLSQKETVYYFNTDEYKTNKKLKNIVKKTLKIKTVPYITYVHEGKLENGISDSSSSLQTVLNLKKN